MNLDELIIDNFAGGGGASLGIAKGLGRGPDIAINHDERAIAVHAANHPATVHLTEDVWKSSPRKVTRGRPVGLLWASPDCKHHSRAKGGKPVEKHIRSLAWVVVRWAVEVKPRLIILENVREFEDWGPLLPRWRCSSCGWKGTEGQAKLARTRRRCPRCESPRIRATAELVPDPARKGLTFRRFVGRLKAQGYDVQWRTLNAADFGAPTHRRRLFLIARRDGLPIEWPEPTHGDPATLDTAPLFGAPLKPWRTAAECIDWSIPCPSIFDRKRPLAEATMRRIALGVKRYVLDNPRPFLVRCAHGDEGRWGSGTADVGAPVPTLTASKDFAVVVPHLVGVGGRSGQSPATLADAPCGTITAKNDRGIVTPIVVPLTHTGERRAHSVEEPLPTVTGANRGELATVAPVLARLGQTGGNGGYANRVDEPVNTIVSKNEHLLIAPTLVQTGYGERAGQAPRVPGLDKPLGTCVDGQKHALVAAFIAKHFGGAVGTEVDTPLPTTLSRGTQNQLIAANLIHMNRGDRTATGADEPARTVTATGKHAALVYSFLVKYFGNAIGCPVDVPLPTVTEKDRCGLVCVTIGGEPYVIVDIGMRMLTPRELARCQGFPDDYQLPGEQLPGTKSAAVAMIGNSVAPPVAAAVVRANCGALAEVA